MPRRQNLASDRVLCDRTAESASLQNFLERRNWERAHVFTVYAKLVTEKTMIEPEFDEGQLSKICGV